MNNKNNIINTTWKNNHQIWCVTSQIFSKQINSEKQAKFEVINNKTDKLNTRE